MVKQDIQIVYKNNNDVYELLYISLDGLRDSLRKLYGIIIPQCDMKENDKYYNTTVRYAITIANNEYHVQTNRILHISIKNTKFKDYIIQKVKL